MTEDDGKRGAAESKQRKPRLSQRMKEELALRMDQLNDRQTAQIRAKFLDRWAELSDARKEDGSWDYDRIDYENKWVKLEFHMCDPKILFKLSDPKYRARGLELLPEDCRATFFEQAPGNSKPYCDVYTGTAAIKKALKKARK